MRSKAKRAGFHSNSINNVRTTPSSLRSRGWCILIAVGVFVIAVNVYVLVGGGLRLAVRQHRQPMIHGVAQPPVLSKHGSWALSSHGSGSSAQRRPTPTTISKSTNHQSDSSHLQQQTHHEKNSDGKERVVEILSQATIEVNSTLRARLPTWEQVTQIVGPQPILYGVPDACTRFTQNVPAVRRMLGAAGMFSTGTNLVTTLLKNNCQIPERVTLYGPNATREDHVRNNAHKKVNEFVI